MIFHGGFGVWHFHLKECARNAFRMSSEQQKHHFSLRACHILRSPNSLDLIKSFDFSETILIFSGNRCKTLNIMFDTRQEFWYMLNSREKEIAAIILSLLFFIITNHGILSRSWTALLRPHDSHMSNSCNFCVKYEKNHCL